MYTLIAAAGRAKRFARILANGGREPTGSKQRGCAQSEHMLNRWAHAHRSPLVAAAGRAKRKDVRIPHQQTQPLEGSVTRHAFWQQAVSTATVLPLIAASV
jgi:hypothetical protein